MRRTIIAPLAAVLASFALITAATLALGAELAHADVPIPGTHPVSLSHARMRPDTLRRLRPTSTFTKPAQCGRSYWTETSAYRLDGGALSAQAWLDRDHTVMVWRDRFGRSVTFDGITWRNHTRRSVLIAGWCS